MGPALSAHELIAATYRAFNARDVEAVLAALHPDVDWPNGMDGGRMRGHAAVRDYWTRQWTMIDPAVEPIAVEVDDAGRVIVDVHQVVRDHAGAVLADQRVQHVYEFHDALITRMEIRKP